MDTIARLLLLILAVAAAPQTAIAADLTTGADWSKICQNKGHGAPACRNSCEDTGSGTRCLVYCHDGYHIGACLVEVSCPGQYCQF